MPFERPTLQQQIDRIRTDMATRLQVGEADLRRSNLGVLSRVMGDAVFALYGYVSWVADQTIIDTAEAENLERHSAIWGVARTAAAASTGNATFSGNTGVIIPAGTELTRADGQLYTTDAEVTLDGAGIATTAVTASTAGKAANTDAAETLTLTEPIAGLSSSATVASGGLSGGSDTELDDALRTRLLDRIQEPPHGGASFDYVKWAKEVSGVTRAWVYPMELGAGTVTVRFVRDNDASPIPDAGEVTAVQNYIDALRPVTVAVTVAAPVAVALDMEIQLTPDDSTTRAAVEAELEDLLLREAEPGATILISHIREAVSVAAGETDHVIVTPTANVTHSTGEIAQLGTITWS